MKCSICPRRCGADRKSGGLGLCGASNEIKIARASLHMWEEPPISGTRGSGTIFFSGCPLGCVFCQNRVISRDGFGKAVSSERLIEIMFELKSKGAHNINLVTPTHFTHLLAPVLSKVKQRLGIPIVYNCGGYELVSSLRALEGLIDIYLPDLKFFSPELSAKYCSAPDYFSFALPAIAEMFRQTGPALFSDDGMMKNGVIVRHLVIPGCRRDSIELLRHLADAMPPRDIMLSLMSQYTPEFTDESHPELRRRITAFEYSSVLEAAAELGFSGCMQQRSSATDSYTPAFDLTGV